MRTLSPSDAARTLSPTGNLDKSYRLGEGIHLSSTGTLFTLFLKRFGIIEKIRQSYSFTEEFVQKALAKKLTWGRILVDMEILYKHDHCDQITERYNLIHVSELDDQSFLDWKTALPWSFWKYPERFCSLHPLDWTKELELYRNICPSHWYSRIRREKEKFLQSYLVVRILQMMQ